jgi:hypothetical protein
MKKIILGLLLLVFIQGEANSQQDTLIFSNEIEMGNYIYGQLDPQHYDSALLNRSASSLPALYQQIGGDYSQVMSTEDWSLIYSDLALSCYDTTLMPTINSMALQINDFFTYHDLNYDELIQPFGLIIQNMNMIDTIHMSNGDLNLVDGQLVSNVPQNILYSKKLIKSASILEFYPDNGYATGNLKYDSTFIIKSDDISLQSIKIDVNDGNGFQNFGLGNPLITYNRSIDSTIAKVSIIYELDDTIYNDTLQFYLTTKSNQSLEKSNDDKWDDVWVNMSVLSGNNLEYDVGIKYGCGNNGKIRRPLIISCAYRPPIQQFSLDKYWNQFNVGGVFDSYVALGYDVIFIKDKPGNQSLEVAGSELAEFIKYINFLKKNNYPDEDWENVVIGYSMGGQKARYALLKLEKEHMESRGPHPHTKLYIPYDSPHHSANIPLFTQATYKTFKNTNLIAALANLSLVDPASRDMGLYSIYNTNELSSSGLFSKDLIPHPDQAAVNYQNELNNNFQHDYTHSTDTRKTFPSFSRNIAVSMGSYKNDYNAKWSLHPGKKLFTQHAPSSFYVPVLGFQPGMVNRKLWASKYSSTTPQPSFSRNDFYVFLGIPIFIRKLYNFQEHYEWDMAQGGYKTLFYDGLAGGAVTILKSGGTGLGTRHYKDEMSFMPLVSALAINPEIWKNNDLYFNLQNEGVMYQKFDFNPTTDKSELFGYPHLGHPTTHFSITPFQAVYADDFNWDHIVMGNTLNDYLNGDQSYFNQLRDFLNDEVEGYIVPLQNKVIGENHVQNTSYEYKAWYKSRDQVIIGNKVTPKTDPGDYIIEQTGNITVFGGQSVLIKPGFHSKAGSTFHAFIAGPSDCYGDYAKSGSSDSSDDDNENTTKTNTEKSSITEELQIKLIPNPNSGNFTFEINQANPNGKLYIYGLEGKLYFEQVVNQTQTRLDISLKSGLYLVMYQTGTEMKSTKLIIN